MPQDGRVGFRCKCGMSLAVPGLSLAEGESIEDGKRRLTEEDWKLTISHLGCALGVKQITCTPDKLILLRSTGTADRTKGQLARLSAREVAATGPPTSAVEKKGQVLNTRTSAAAAG